MAARKRPVGDKHIPSPDCWCKPKVTMSGSTQTIEHRKVTAPDAG